MKLPEISERTQQSGAYVEQMWSIAACQESRSLEEFLEDLDDDDMKELFPNINIEEYTANIRYGEMYGLLINYGYLGHVLEIAVPERSDFNLDENDEYTHCSVHSGITRVIYAYAETGRDIVNELEKAGKKVLAENIAEFKKAPATSNQ